MPKNLVICCDLGFIPDFATNVIRLYRTLDIDERSKQVAYYHSSSLESPNKRFEAYAFGSGISDEISRIYSYPKCSRSISRHDCPIPYLLVRQCHGDREAETGRHQCCRNPKMELAWPLRQARRERHAHSCADG